MRLILCALLFSSCAKDIVTTQGTVHARVKDERTQVVTRTEWGPLETGKRKCDYPGICLNCGLDIYGKYSCGLKYYFHCPGEQSIEFRRATEVRITHYDTSLGAYQSPAFQVEVKKVEKEGHCR